MKRGKVSFKNLPILQKGVRLVSENLINMGVHFWTLFSRFPLAEEHILKAQTVFASWEPETLKNRGGVIRPAGSWVLLPEAIVRRGRHTRAGVPPGPAG